MNKNLIFPPSICFDKTFKEFAELYFPATVQHISSAKSSASSSLSFNKSSSRVSDNSFPQGQRDIALLFDLWVLN